MKGQTLQAQGGHAYYGEVVVNKNKDNYIIIIIIYTELALSWHLDITLQIQLALSDIIIRLG